MEKEKPIGVLDIGLAGLTVVKRITSVLPKENIVYYSDTVLLPEAIADAAAVRASALQGAAYLEKRGVKLLLIASAAIAASAGNEIRSRLTIPVLDILTAGVTAALRAAGGQSIAVLETGRNREAVLMLEHLRGRGAGNAFVLTGVTPPHFTQPEIHKTMPSVKESGANLLLCSAPVIGSIFAELCDGLPPGITAVDPGQAAAAAARENLERIGFVSNSHALGRVEINLTMINPELKETAAGLLGQAPGFIGSITG